MSGPLRGQSKGSQRQLSQQTSNNCCLLHLGPVFPSASNWPLWSRLLALLTSQIKAHLLLQARQSGFLLTPGPRSFGSCCLSALGKREATFQFGPCQVVVHAAICQGGCILQGAALCSRGAVEECCGFGWGGITLPSIIIILRRCHRCQFPSGETRDKKGQYKMKYEDILTFRNIETYQAPFQPHLIFIAFLAPLKLQVMINLTLCILFGRFERKKGTFVVSL